MMKFVISFLFLSLWVTIAPAKSSQEPQSLKSNLQKPEPKATNDKDIILSKNTQSTLYLLSGWGKAEGPYVWFTVSAHFNENQVAPNSQNFNLFSASGAIDCKENSTFYYLISYMYFDPKTKKLSEIYSEKNKSNVMKIEPTTTESDIKKIVCN
ncbi:surface-adhesin E family protein [Polynucleobacter sp. MG-Unter2-18]|uniref:surface-adhesin E family protein n=1 Tax=Polynucleobacter sp. MG-Unter2-18 TaxID=2081052 RepID=UPI001BFCDD9D|nr:surface-adhesin E family protein [Polynucleobacter sp. MG-Unter2-18]